MRKYFLFYLSITFCSVSFASGICGSGTLRQIQNFQTGKIDFVCEYTSSTLPSGSTQYISASSSNTFVTYSSASLSYLGISSGTSSADSLTKSSASISYIGISSLTISNGILTLSSASVSYTALSSSTINPFVSTFSATDLNGFKIYASSGAIAANTAITITIPGTTQLWFPQATEIETTNTAVVSIRVKNITATSYQVYNADAINAKAYVTSVFGR